MALSWKPQPVSLCNPECLSGIRSGLNLVLDQFESGCLGPLCMWYSLFCFYMFNTQRGLGVDLGLNNIGEENFQANLRPGIGNLLYWFGLLVGLLFV